MTSRMTLKKWIVGVFALVTFLRPILSAAQIEDTPPSEPPYTQEENEFDPEPEVSAAKNAENQKSSQKADANQTDQNRITTEVEAAQQSDSFSDQPPSDLEAELSKKNEGVDDESQSLNTESLKEDSLSTELNEEPSESESPKSEENYRPVRRKNAKGGVEYIRHPQAANGLLIIEKDGTYIYKAKEDSSFTKTGILRFGGIDAPKIIAKDNVTNFETMYQGSPVPYLMYDYEWQPFTSFGRLGIQAGLGFLVSQGNGRFACTSCGTLNGTQAKERYTFVAIPISLGGVYRLAWMDHPWLAPFASGGGVYVPVAELRDDNSSPHGLGTLGAYGAGGLMFNLSALDRDTGFILRRDYGISNLWLSGEFRYLKTFSDAIDFTSSIVSFGLGVDY